MGIGDKTTALGAGGRLVLLSVVTTFFSLIPTLYAAWISNSVLLFADALRCTTEFCAIFVSWLVLTKSTRNEQLSYNYGFGKLEQLASVAVGGALLLSFIISCFSAVMRFISPQIVESVEFGFILGVLSLCGNGFLWSKNRSAYIRYPSPILDSQWRLFRAKTFATLVVAVSLGASLWFHHDWWVVYLDPIASLLLSLFLLFSAYTVLASSVPDLVDRAVAQEIQLIIMQSLVEFRSEYRGLEKVRTRRSGAKIFVDIFLSFEGDSPLAEVHRVVMLIKESLGVRLPGAEVVVIASVQAKESDNVF